MIVAAIKRDVDAERAEPRPIIVRLADVQPEAIEWLWPGRLAARKLTLLVGDPGLGKSWLTLDIAARLSTGRAWCDGAVPPSAGDVLLLSAEDGIADTIRPRLDALGADVTRVHHVAVVRAANQERAIKLADVDIIEQAIRETRAKLVIVDPLSAYLGATDSHRDAEVRGLLAPLSATAEANGAAVLAVMHLSKGGHGKAIYRAVGSIAFAAAARVVLAVAADPDQPSRRLMAPVKSNLSLPPSTLAYTLTDGRLVWEASPVTDVDIDQLLAGPPIGAQREEQTDAEQVIAELLDDESAWPMDARQALEAGAARGIHERTMRRTAQRIGIRIARSGFGRGGRWVWHRPIADSATDTRPETVSVSAMSAMPEQASNSGHTHIEDNKTAYRARAREEDPDVLDRL